MDNNTKEKILHEISYLNNFINTSKPLLNFCKINEPNFTEITALAMILHAFYNGVESIFLLILKSRNEIVPSDGHWHKGLFDIMFGKNSMKTAFIREDLKNMLRQYLDFRHFIRHSYSTILVWGEMKNLVENLEETWTMIKSDFERMMEEN